MADFTESDDLHGATFADTNIRDARFIGAGLSGVVMRGVEIAGADIDAPWLAESSSGLRVNGVDAPRIRRRVDRR